MLRNQLLRKQIEQVKVMSTTDTKAILPPSTALTADTLEQLTNANPEICRYFLRGNCRFGVACHFSHDVNGMQADSQNSDTNVCGGATEKPSTSRNNNDWANAPVFVPKNSATNRGFVSAAMAAAAAASASVASNNDTYKSWAEVVGACAQTPGMATLTAQMHFLDLSAENSAQLQEEICPYMPPCPFMRECVFGFHMQQCKMCDQYCLHPKDADQRRKHNQECLAQHEKDMELSFAIARSKDKTCGICFDTIIEKAGREKRFGILPNCNHIFCLECIRKWRQAKQFEHKIIR